MKKNNLNKKDKEKIDKLILLTLKVMDLKKDSYDLKDQFEIDKLEKRMTELYIKSYLR